MRDIDRLFDESEERCVLRIHAQPGASRNAVAGVHGDSLKVRLRVRPQEGAANEGLIVFLAECLRVRRRDVVLISGRRSRSKRVAVRLEPDELRKRLENLLGGAG